MPTRYFATQTANIQVHCKTGKAVRWSSPDGVNAMTAIPETDADLAECIDVCIKTGTGGLLREVKFEEFDAWQKKSLGRRYHRERESIGSSGPASDTLMPKIKVPDAAPVAVDSQPKRMEDGFNPPPNQVDGDAPRPAPPAPNPTKPAPVPITRRRGPTATAPK